MALNLLPGRIYGLSWEKKKMIETFEMNLVTGFTGYKKKTRIKNCQLIKEGVEFTVFRAKWENSPWPAIILGSLKFTGLTGKKRNNKNWNVGNGC